MTRRESKSLVQAAWVLVCAILFWLGWMAAASGQVQIISEPTAQPTLAAPCVCHQGDGECTCTPECDCQPSAVESKPIISVARFPTVNNEPRVPITLAPDPDYPLQETAIDSPAIAENAQKLQSEQALQAFRDRWADPNRKTYTGAKIPSEPLAASAASRAPVPPQQSRATKAAPPPSKPTLAGGPMAAQKGLATLPSQPSAKSIDRAVMVRTYVCDQYGCRYEWRPAASVGTRRIETQRRGLFRRFR